MDRRCFVPVLLLSWMLCATSLEAQSVVDPGFLEFTASSDHEFVDQAGQPAVARYEFQLYAVGSAAPIRTVDLGKPTPDANGTIRVPLTTILNPLPAGGTVYEARVAAVGAGGSTPSIASNTFSFQVPCTYSVAPVSRSMGAASGTTTVAVTAPSGCAWTATTTTAWMAVADSSSRGSGNGTVTVAVRANAGTQARIGSLLVAGTSVTVVQGILTVPSAPAGLRIAGR